MQNYILDACALITDTILIATAVCSGATVVTCDHLELEPVEKQGIVPFLWIRPQF